MNFNLSNWFQKNIFCPLGMHSYNIRDSEKHRYFSTEGSVIIVTTYVNCQVCGKPMIVGKYRY